MRLSRRQALVGGLLLPAAPRAALASDASLGARARWLAGMDPLAGVEPTAEWSAHARTEDERWRSARPRLDAMAEWSSREIRLLLSREHALFYPFAGPDALHAIALFGGVRRMLLVGLEPVGELPEPDRTPPGYFSRLSAALADVHRLTFFRTQEMSTDFQREGILAALVATIARMGGKVASARTEKKPARARVDWLTAAGEPRRLDYVQADLSNAGLSSRPELAANLHALAPVVTFVKAAMYLLAEGRFSILRQAILDDSGVVVQDDTGVPLRHFDARWATRLFGRYEPPGPPFEERVQPDLRAAFERRARPLPFGVGYHVRADRSNLLIASKGS